MESDTRKTLILLAVLAVLVAGALGPVLDDGFVAYDDEDYVYNNPRVNGGLTRDGFAWAFRSVGYSSNWHPLTWLSHMADVSLFGLEPRGHHLTSLVLHLASTLLLFVALRLMTGAPWPSFVAAALFGVHPLHVESVAWVSERKDVLAGLFWMLALAGWGLWARRRLAAGYAAAVLFLGLGLMSKPMVLTLPLVLLILDWWPLERPPAGSWRDGLPRLVFEKLPLFALAAASGWVNWMAQNKGGATRALDLPFGARLGNALTAYATYPLKALWPSNLAPFYPHPGTTLPWWKPVLAFLALAAVSWLAFAARRRRPYLWAGWLWYLVTLVPVAGFVQAGWQSMADRYTYLPLIGLFIMAGWWLAEAAAAPGAARKVVAAGVAAWLLVLAGVSRVQAGYWRDTTTLFEHTLRATGDNWLAEYTLGNELWRAGKTAEAESRFRRAVALNPSFGDAHNNLGALLLRDGRLADALQELNKAVHLSPGDPVLRMNLGIALEKFGHPEAALKEYQEALRIRPDYGDAKARLAIVLLKIGHQGGAAGSPADLTSPPPTGAAR